MNFHKAKILLEKINRLHSNMSDDQDHISPIEKDLMLNYVREYYELFYWDKQQDLPKTSPSKSKPKAKAEPVAAPKPKPAPPKPKPEPVVATPKPKPVEVKPPAPKPAPKPEPKPVVVEEIAEVIDVVSTPPKKVVEEKPKPKKEPAKVVFKPAKPKTKAKESELDPESEALFETKQAKELSEKLGLSPIMDLNKAFGLNDRMLYTNELFSGDNNVYKETMAVLEFIQFFGSGKGISN